MKVKRPISALVIGVCAAFTAAIFISAYQEGSLDYVKVGPPREKEPATRPVEETEPPVTHLSTPVPLRAIYLTSWVAGTSRVREPLLRLVDETEINAVVIDIKDFSGRVAIRFDDPRIRSYGAIEERIPDAKALLRDLHKRGIYAIARITVFQDPHLAEARKDLAVQRSDGTLWRDKKGLAYMDPGATEVWDYHVALGKAAYEIGFDELNFDYIRYPSDGDMSDIYFPISEEEVVTKPFVGKADVIERFFAYLSQHLRTDGIPTSADLFGMTMTNPDDLNIGQVLERADPYFDYIAPMVYPSHYPPTFIGLPNPAAEPYKVVRYSLDHGVARLFAASSTPSKIRPWLQDFNLGAHYTKEMVRAEIEAVYDAGLSSWMLWNSANVYTRGALLTEGEVRHGLNLRNIVPGYAATSSSNGVL